MPCGGLSPRLRGNLIEVVHTVYRAGSIPAPAGEPHEGEAVSALTMVYPRACGGTPPSCRPAFSWVGLSPRLRGNLGVLFVQGLDDRSIPAPAGEPVPGQKNAPGYAVYPRACGGTFAAAERATASVGLSPRLRGNLDPDQQRRSHCRSIPAPAGEPRLTGCIHRVYPVYPRACGGTRNDVALPAPESGLSPRLRGNRWRRRRAWRPLRSIPAPAGEPK